MRNYIGYIIDYSDRNLSDQKRKWFEGELVHNEELNTNYTLFKQVNDIMRSRFDQEEVLNDLNRHNNIDTLTNQMISEFQENPNKFKQNRQFIENSLIDKSDDPELQAKLNQTRLETEKHKVNEVTEKWVEEWNARNQQTDSTDESRRVFITSSLSSSDVSGEISRKTIKSKKYVIRWSVLAAAAMIAALVVIKSLNQYERPDNLYQEYYKPLNAYTSTTRNSANIVEPFSGAVDLYKQGQYRLAAVEFSNLLLEDSNNTAALFFSGITQLELGNYKQAIGSLNEVVSKNGDFKKESQWYLGLAYLKIGETQKTLVYLNELAKSRGYYQNQAQDLLNHLK